ncbi:MAG TPA: methylenetetrahydrofolate reductase [Steroidobacteraceae bacterium]|nr:methylenetetrahydrofolate reductase [Steroidobacteraceae bacterium]
MNASVDPRSGSGAALTPPALKQRIVEFARGSSTEISPHDEGLIAELAGIVPARTTVYVAHTPKASIGEVVRIAAKVQAAGLRASPHIVARRIESRQVLRQALREVRDAGIEQVLLVAGDRNPPAGEFTSTLEILDSGAITDAGLANVGVAGHPEGHPAVSQEVLWSALKTKQAFAERTGLKLHICTQFSFNPAAVEAWDQRLSEHGIRLPVHIGIAGPTPLPKLIKFAMMCGIGNSLGALGKGMALMGRVAGLAMSPDEMLIELARSTATRSGTHLVHPHVYAFGGVIATARWLRAVIDGAFELDEGGEKFTVRA